MLVALAALCGVQALAQDAGTLTAEPLPDGAPAQTATSVADTPTRRPTRRATATATDTAVATAPPTDTPADTPTAAPPSATPTAEPTLTPTRIAALPPTMPPAPPVAALPAGAALGALDPGLLHVVLGVLLALLSAWLGARLARAGERRERQRARRALASAMLLELRRIDAVLRRVVALDTPTSFPSLDHPIIEGALRDLTLFNAETAARIAQFHGALRGIQHEVADYRDNPLRWAGRLGELNQIIRSRAAAACRAVPELLKSLERSGGARPPHLGEPAPAGGQRAELPPPPFGATDGDDWTL
ncbi:hypothetical protein KF840_20745 [bacterium]|nr:hypothetical protein [bacterium]